MVPLWKTKSKPTLTLGLVISLLPFYPTEAHRYVYVYGHTTLNVSHLVSPWKLSRARPGQYWMGEVWILTHHKDIHSYLHSQSAHNSQGLETNQSSLAMGKDKQ